MEGKKLSKRGKEEKFDKSEKKKKKKRENIEALYERLKIFRRDFGQKWPKWPGREGALLEITEKMGKKYFVVISDKNGINGPVEKGR